MTVMMVTREMTGIERKKVNRDTDNRDDGDGGDSEIIQAITAVTNPH